MATKKKDKKESQRADDVEPKGFEIVDEVIDEECSDDATATFEALSEESLDKESADVIQMESKKSKDAASTPADDDSIAVSSDSEDSDDGKPHEDAPTLLSLDRLQEDLQQLQDSWADVEQRFAEKDSEIAWLNDERDVHIAAFKIAAG